MTSEEPKSGAKGGGRGRRRERREGQGLKSFLKEVMLGYLGKELILGSMCVTVYIGEIPLSCSAMLSTIWMIGCSHGQLGGRSIACQLSLCIVLYGHALTFLLRSYEVIML